MKMPNSELTKLNDLQHGVEFTSDSGSLRVNLKRNQELGTDLFLSVMRVQVNLPIFLPLNTDPDPSRYFGIRLDNISSPSKSVNNKGLLIIFGRMNEAAFFLKPQKPDIKYSVSVLNYIWNDNRISLEPEYYSSIAKKTNTLQLKSLIYNFTNEHLGCAYYCDGESPILAKNILNGTVNYIFNILLYDAQSVPSSSRDKEIWNVSFGFFKNGTWELLKNSNYTTVDINFDQKETKIKEEDEIVESGEDSFSLFN